MTGTAARPHPARGGAPAARQPRRGWRGWRSRTPASRSPRRMSVDIDSGADAIEYFAGLAPSLHGDHLRSRPAPSPTRGASRWAWCAGIGAWNYPLQIACWKSGAGAGLRQHHGVQAVRADADDRGGAGRRSSPRPACRPACSTSSRARRDVGQALVTPSRRRQGVADRLGADRPQGHGRRRRDAEARDHGAGRQVAADRLRRRRSRERGQGGDDGQLLHPGRGLLERHPGVRRGAAAQPLHGPACWPAPSGCGSATRWTRRPRSAP